MISLTVDKSQLGRQVDAELKLDLLRNKLQLSEDSPILAAMHKEHSV